MRKYSSKDIGLREYQVPEGFGCWYYGYYCPESNSNSEPIRVKIISKVYNHIGGQPTVMTDNVSGVVALSHLSETYYPEEHNKSSKSNWKYKEYIDNDYHNHFSDYLGIQLPKREYGSFPQSGVRYVSTKYRDVNGEYCKTIKEAKKSYKEKLLEYKCKNKALKNKYVIEHENN